MYTRGNKRSSVLKCTRTDTSFPFKSLVIYKSSKCQLLWSHWKTIIILYDFALYIERNFVIKIHDLQSNRRASWSLPDLNHFSKYFKKSIKNCEKDFDLFWWWIILCIFRGRIWRRFSAKDRNFTMLQKNSRKWKNIKLL